MERTSCLHLDLDGAWPPEVLGAGAYLDAREWGTHLRYSATRRGIEEFFAAIAARAERFTLSGSGDFHHLTALWLRRIEEPFTLISFDNHPDWDIRPPRWCCGTWISRALELPLLRRASIWGCGNFELNWPASLFANHRNLRSERLRVWPWRGRLDARARRNWPGITRENWRGKFSAFAAELSREAVYITVDLDCLQREEAATNWEQGLFTADDVVWAIQQLAEHARIVGGDLCGAQSPPSYARFRQRLLATHDHPRLELIDREAASALNLRALRKIWPALTGNDEDDASADQQHAQPHAGAHFFA